MAFEDQGVRDDGRDDGDVDAGRRAVLRSIAKYSTVAAGAATLTVLSADDAVASQPCSGDAFSPSSRESFSPTSADSCVETSGHDDEDDDDEDKYASKDKKEKRKIWRRRRGRWREQRANHFKSKGGQGRSSEASGGHNTF